MSDTRLRPQKDDLLGVFLISVNFCCDAILPRRLIELFLLFGRLRFAVHENPMRRPFQIIKLTGTHRPPEQSGDHEHQHNRYGNKQIKRFHNVLLSNHLSAMTLRCNRREFKTTQSELNDMPMPASQGVNKPLIATGKATAL